MFRKFTLVLCGLLALFAIVQTQPTQAQDTCNALVETAFEFIGNNCDGLGRNRACYGYNRLEATFFEGFAAAAFSQPSDRTDVETLRTISTRPLDLDENEWGLAVMNLQANIPNTLPGQNAVFLMFGDVAVEDTTMDVPSSGQTIRVRLGAAASLREDPLPSADVLTELAAGTEVDLTSLSENGLWVRATAQDLVGWLLARPLGVDLSALSVYAPEEFQPMQSIYFTTGVGTANCEETPDLLVVQGPRDITIQMQINGADVQLGSTIALRTISPGVMELSVIDGEVVVNPGTPDEFIVPVGFSVTAQLSDPQALGVDDNIENRTILGGWSDPQPIPPDTLQALQVLERFPTNLLNYGIVLPGVQVAQAPPPTDCTVAEPVGSYTIQPGDSLSRIASDFGTTAEQLAADNCITNPDLITVGQEIGLPVAVTTPTAIPTPIPTDPPPPPPVDDGGDDEDDGGGDPPPPPPPAGSLVVSSGDGQALFYQTNGDALSVRAEDGDNNPLFGREVTFAITSGPAVFASGTTTETVTTADEDGLAFASSSELTAPVCGGAGTVQATSPGLNSVTFTYALATTITVTSDMDSGAGSLREAVQRLECGGTVNIGVTNITLTGGEVLLDNAGPLVIDGDAQIDGGSISRVLNVAAGSTVTLRNITVTGGSSTGDGGGILNAGTLTLDAVFVGTNLAEGRGGGIANTGTLNITNNSTVTSNSTLLDGGGGIFSSGNLTIINSTVGANSASGAGGGVFNTGTLTVSSSSINDNNAGVDGGGVFNEGTANISGSQMNENFGGAAVSVGGEINFNGVTFVANDAGMGFSTVLTVEDGAVGSFVNSAITAAGFGFNDCNDGGGEGGTIIDNGGNTGGDGTCYPD